MFRRKKKDKGQNFYDQLEKQLEDHPDSMFVCNEYLAVKIPDHGIFVVLGDYRDCTAEEANQALCDALDRFEQNNRDGMLVATRL